MNDEGSFTVHRAVFKHPLFEGEEYCRLAAWNWLLGHAVWKPVKVRIGSKIVPLERGQCAYSERFLANKWKWSKSKVHRFLGRLKTESMIELKTDHEVNQITICNYDNYQFSGTRDRTASEPASGPAADQLRTKEEEVNKSKMQEAPRGALVLIEQASEEKALFDRGKAILGQSSGSLIARLLKSKKGSIPLARAAIEQASTKQDAREYIGRIINGPAAANERHGYNDPLAGIQ